MHHSHPSLRRISALRSLLLCSLLIGAAAAHSQTVLSDPIKIDSGYVAGTLMGDAATPVRVYRGIPYAQPPVGELRWRAPQPVKRWEGIREATRFGAWAAQRYPTAAVFEVATDADMSEDCLYLNVLTPAKRRNDKLPVLVWFHGGGLDTLSGNMLRYNTPQLPQTGAVVVTVTHRLGAFGYLAHPWLSAESAQGVSGNYGQLDLIASLEWVQRNIAAFGGDPRRVTIFGQSGGGRKVNFLMVSPLVPDGLFHRAISQSGSIGSLTKAEAERSGVTLTDALNVQSLAELRAKPWRDIVQAATRVRYSGQFVEDGWSLLEPITKSFADGDQKNVPYMIGMVATEDSGHFNMPIDLLPTVKRKSAPIFAYVFTAVPAGWRKDGVTGWHAIDIGYTFASLEQAFSNAKPEYFRAYAQAQGAQSRDPGLSGNDQQLAYNIKKMWVQFAASGNPSIPGVVQWPAYAGSEQYLEMDLPLAAKSGFSKLQQPASMRSSSERE